MIAFVYGTRPEAIKISPVVEELRALGISPFLICTGQHTDLLSGTPADTVLASATNLAIPSGNHVRDYLHRAIPAINATLRELTPALVAVQGDTMSVLAGAKAAQQLAIPIAHLEAGVRTWADEPWPEESIRQHVTQLATYHYAATDTAVDNLWNSQVAPERILLTGNPGISALYRYTDARPRDAVGHTIVITLHRRELRIKGLVPALRTQLWAAARAAPHFTFLWPLHPGMRNLVLDRASRFNQPPNLFISDPIPYRDMLPLVSGATGLLTDSGGLVEEAATLGVPTAILRHHNDRPEAVEAGIARRFDPEAVSDAVSWLVRTKIRPFGGSERQPLTLYGEADSARRIAEHLALLFWETL